MDELIALVSEKTGLSKEMSKVAVDTVLGYLKERLPEPIAGRIDDVIEGMDASGLDELTGGLGSLLGGNG